MSERYKDRIEDATWESFTCMLSSAGRLGAHLTYSGILLVSHYCLSDWPDLLPASPATSHDCIRSQNHMICSRVMELVFELWWLPLDKKIGLTKTISVGPAVVGDKDVGQKTTEEKLGMEEDEQKRWDDFSLV
ncbi:hypothetical protein MLD38_020816 [Melastoma candidum]|uniref:Uncharacterized protein n=1 Tax=Melastoma candidum TaxID=119954 RepID=A0ACB9QM83_9MYRT|nr:hypothetical protein MLD38_020816 [Melastoma candidum]